MTAFWLVVIAIAVVLAEGWLWPVRRCRKCGGKGQFHSPVTRSWRPCSSCEGGVTLKWRAKLLGRRAA